MIYMYYLLILKDIFLSLHECMLIAYMYYHVLPPPTSSLYVYLYCFYFYHKRPTLSQLFISLSSITTHQYAYESTYWLTNRRYAHYPRSILIFDVCEYGGLHLYYITYNNRSSLSLQSPLTNMHMKARTGLLIGGMLITLALFSYSIYASMEGSTYTI